MEVLNWQKENSVAVISMCNGANRQDLEFGTQLNRCFDEILKDEGVSSIVITSSDEKNFSQGVDVEWLTERMALKEFVIVKQFMYEMNAVFKRLLLMPVPVIAAINGHAYGNGAILSCACDFRFMTADKGFFCFPEVNVNIPFLPGMLAFVQKAIPEYLFNQMLLTGNPVDAGELERHNVIVQSGVDKDDMMQKAVAFAEQFQKNRPIFAELKKRKYKEIIEVIEKEDPEFIEPLNLMMG